MVRAWLLALLSLLVLGCAPKPIAFRAHEAVRSVEVALAEVPPAEVYYHRHKPPGLLGYLGTGGYTVSNIYRSWADSQKTQMIAAHIEDLKAGELVADSFMGALRQARVFERLVRAGLDQEGSVADARIELVIDRWGFSYATEGKVSAEVVVEARMRPAQGGELLWRRRLVVTDGARWSVEELDLEGGKLRAALLKTLRAAGQDLARDLIGKGSPTRGLLPPRI